MQKSCKFQHYQSWFPTLSTVQHTATDTKGKAASVEMAKSLTVSTASWHSSSYCPNLFDTSLRTLVTKDPKPFCQRAGISHEITTASRDQKLTLSSTSGIITVFGEALPARSVGSKEAICHSDSHLSLSLLHSLSLSSTATTFQQSN